MQPVGRYRGGPTVPYDTAKGVKNAIRTVDSCTATPQPRTDTVTPKPRVRLRAAPRSSLKQVSPVSKMCRQIQRRERVNSDEALMGSVDPTHQMHSWTVGKNAVNAHTDVDELLETRERSMKTTIKGAIPSESADHPTTQWIGQRVVC